MWPLIFTTSQVSYIDSVLNEVMYYDDEFLYTELEAANTFHFMYVNSTYNNKTYYAGREVANPMYYLSGQVSYFNSKGFFVGFGTSSGTWFSTNDDAHYNNALVVGYGKSLKKVKWLRYNISYSRFFGINQGLNFSSTYSNNAHFGFGTKFKWIGSRAGVNILFGKATKATFSWDLYTNITIAKMSAFKSIKLEPELSFFYDSEEVEQVSDINQQTSYANKFGWMNTELNLPITFNLNDFDVELAYTINLPRSLDLNYSYDTTNLFTISVGYIISL